MTRANIDGAPVVISEPALVLVLPIEGSPRLEVAGAGVAGPVAVLVRVLLDLDDPGEEFLAALEGLIAELEEARVGG